MVEFCVFYESKMILLIKYYNLKKMYIVVLSHYASKFEKLIAYLYF